MCTSHIYHIINISEIFASIYRNIQVDFASRECQVHFFEKLKASGQMVAGDHLWELHSRRSQEFDPRDERFSGRCVKYLFEFQPGTS